MRDFELEVYFSKWEFKAKHHMTASDIESMSVKQLLTMASAEERAEFEELWLGYTETWGAPKLIREISSTYTHMKAENILCLAGAGEGIYAVSKCLLSPADHAIVPTPNYQSSETIPLSICEVTGVPLRAIDSVKGGWQLDIDEVKKAIRPNTKLISINFPHNPTGALITQETVDELILLCRHYGIYILSDEVYRGVELNQDDQMPQIADVYEKGISLNVMSKAYGLPGLRVGWIATQDRDILQRVERYKHFLSICNSAPSEFLSLIALKNRETILARNKTLMRENLSLLEPLFSEYSELIEWQRPMGGCVAFPRYIGPGGVEKFCKSLLEEKGVLLLPSSIYQSELTTTPNDRFRIGFGRDQVFKDGLVAMREHFDLRYKSYRN